MSPALRSAPAQALDALAEADARLGAPWLSLAPERAHARSLAAIGRALLEPEAAAAPPEPAAYDAFAEGLAAIALAVRDAFPHISSAISITSRRAYGTAPPRRPRAPPGSCGSSAHW